MGEAEKFSTLRPFLLAWINCNPSMDNVGWNYCSIPKLQRLNCRSLWGPTGNGLLNSSHIVWWMRLLKMLGLKLIHVVKCVTGETRIPRLRIRAECSTAWAAGTINIMTSSNGNIFRVAGPLSPLDSPHKGQWREQTTDQTIATLVIWDANALIMTLL